MIDSARSAAANGATRILPRLWMGPRPPVGDTLARAGFQHLFLCARERIPGQPASLFPGVRTHRVPLDDPPGPVAAEDEVRALHAAREVVSLLHRGQRVLVTCSEGRNRSGVVCALVVRLGTGLWIDDAIAHVKRLRDPMLPFDRPSLANPRWLDALRSMAPSPERRFAIR